MIKIGLFRNNGKPCPKCGKTLYRIVVNGRDSVYCPACQKNSEKLIIKLRVNLQGLPLCQMSSP
ncbi:MAG: hypothetical protein HFI77_15115 [Lachnospiraceae bacterium]|nr:hypothetical protein [Lachnospiraceae bacterium]